MNKVTFLIISFLISILTVFATLFTNPENFYVWLAFIVIILLAPIVFVKITIKNQSITKKDVLFFQVLVLCIALTLASKNIMPWSDDYMVAITKSPIKANEIQEVLTTSTRPTKRQIIYTNDRQTAYGISVKKMNPEQNRLVTTELLNSDIFDNSIILCPNVKYTSNRLKMLKRLKKECVNILYGIKGITWVELKIVPPKNINDNNAKIKSITVEYETAKNADSKKIRKTVETFLNSLFKDLTTEIIIEDLVSNSKAYSLIAKARDEFENKNYSKASEFVKEASKLNNHYSNDINTISKIIKLEKIIKNDTKNYQNYIKMGDLLSSDIFTANIHSNLEAAKNYEKALKLNPNAYEAYEKIGQAYAYLSMKYSITAVFSTDTKDKELKQKYKEKSIEYYLKAIKHSQGNNRIYESLADYYYDNEDYNKALEYYNKINTQNDCSFDSELSNKKVYANLKTGHYIEAWKEAKGCSLWLCRLVHLNFTPDNEI